MTRDTRETQKSWFANALPKTEIGTSSGPIGTAGLGYSGAAVSLAKKKQKKAKEEKNNDKSDIRSVCASDDELDDDIAEHGVIEDSMEVSRTSLAGKRKGGSKNTGQYDDSQAEKTKVKNKKAKEAPLDTGIGTSEEKKSEGDEVVVVETEKEKKAPPKGYWGELKAQPVEIIDGEVVKRKKKKTRSKQKNIVRDTRPQEERPNYRPLSLQTLTKQAQRKTSTSNS